MYRVLLFLLLLQHTTVQAQTNEDSMELVNHMGNSTIPSVNNSSGHIVGADSSVRDAASRYNRFVYEHRINAYSWQLLSSKIIFSVVIIIVLTGLYLSYMQFKLSNVLMRSHGKKKPLMADALEEPEAERMLRTTLELGKEGFKINSAVIGLLVLMVSIAFFFLYLQYAFSIKE